MLWPFSSDCFLRKHWKHDPYGIPKKGFQTNLLTKEERRRGCVLGLLTKKGNSTIPSWKTIGFPDVFAAAVDQTEDTHFERTVFRLP